MLLSFVASLQSVLADTEIPLLGENAGVHLAREVKLGRGLYLRLKEQGYVIDDPLLSRYLSDIGHSLLSQLDYRARDYHFYLVRDASVNAFATPGGYIGVNVGLIAMTQKEDELASVLAHEIAHVELKHSMQLIEKSEDVNLAGMISILAAILVSGANSDLASAIIYTSAAGSTQSLINFTRANEYEADRVGVKLIQQSDYDASAMVDFMQILQSREQVGEFAGIEYIRTHPINSNRIAEIRSRLDQYPEKKRSSDIGQRFSQFRDYLFYQYPDLGINTKTDFYNSLQHMRLGSYAEAEKTLLRLQQQDPDSIWYSYALAENLEFQKRYRDALQIYQKSYLLYPDEFAIGSRIINLYLLLNQPVEALQVANRLLSMYPKNERVYSLLVAIHEVTKNETMKQLAKADFHWFTGNRKQAKKMYQSLIDSGLLDLVEEQKIKEKLELESRQKD